MIFKQLNALPLFDVGRWRGFEALARAIGVVAVTLFVGWRVLRLPEWPGYVSEVAWARPGFDELRHWLGAWVAPNVDLEGYYYWYGYSAGEVHLLWTSFALVWTLETGVLLGYLAAFLTRDRARRAAFGFMETVYPLLLAGLPLLIIRTPYTYPQWFPQHAHFHLAGLCVLYSVLFVGTLLNVLGLFSLRRSFSIMTETRTLVRSGLYRWVRHPLYASHFITYFGCMVLHFQAMTVALYGAFVAGQILRAKIEEAKLCAAFPEYESYRRETGMLFPRILGRKPEPPASPGP